MREEAVSASLKERRKKNKFRFPCDNDQCMECKKFLFYEMGF